VGQFWSSLGSASIEVEISFHGLQVRSMYLISE
jgi:hypothetical protein